ncbi:pyridoxamine 5'-phosphate oxidase [Amylibacter sp. SFDW26]|uniref:pyridoxamine 5'-phosphate oxidase family protein n=1 Tax=Amylibacter sp. SFDW26 TaxID=2652722 RepID=UPI0012629975|nr:pyridoxamine 5'-phosphate oxidase family protein [Amylibacter sp. SFDW26]KAB7615553.1 pyridoxamine 5'-phosphate oxidase [Amylibacter sp. SFDW26]
MSDTSVFHDGELFVQNKLGVTKDVAKFAPRAIRDFMPDQHRLFYQMLPMMIMGALDDQGRPWATAAFGQRGFMHSPDQHTLQIGALPVLHDTLNLQIGAKDKLGFVGIELETRRRNRMNGVVDLVTEHGLTVTVDQSYGNCPQYIQRRDVNLRMLGPDAQTVTQSKQIDANAKQIIEAADTFFIASRTQEIDGDPRSGIDASHRGGHPGFVKVTEKGHLMFPDFSGNQFYNTLGNIAADGRVGLFIPEFDTGRAVFLTGRAEIIWDGPEVDAFMGAERSVMVNPEAIIVAENVLPIKGDLVEPWPLLKNTGHWE